MKRGWLFNLLGLSLVAAAVRQEMQKPAAERTWQGKVGPIPYDLRPPTLDRIRASVWNPDNPSPVAPMAFGVGWTINAYRLLHPNRS